MIAGSGASDGLGNDAASGVPVDDNWYTQFLADASQLNPHIHPAELNYSVNYSTRYNYLYIENPKVACSSIKATLIRAEFDDETIRWPNVDELHDRSLSPLQDMRRCCGLTRVSARQAPYTFCLVRNPYTRLLSAWLDKIVGNAPPKRDLLLALGRGVRPINQTISFAEFIELIAQQTPSQMDAHWRRQYDQTSQNGFHFDTIGRFERLDEDWRTISEALQLPTFARNLVGERRHATGADEQLRQHYSTELVRKVREIYAIDFEAFDYDHETPF
ncbi:sulfotransferase family protein [Gammaproteobacteria bacterium]|nr:sulfotransferase family protein [Gammaproteobacteria bacterium]